MGSLGTLGVALTVIFSLLAVLLAAELYYLLVWKRRGLDNRVTNISQDSGARSVDQAEISPPEDVLDAEQLAAKMFPIDLEGDIDLCQMHYLLGPPRLLFTIKEETKEDLDFEELKSIVAKSRKASADSTEAVTGLESGLDYEKGLCKDRKEGIKQPNKDRIDGFDPKCGISKGVDQERIDQKGIDQEGIDKKQSQNRGTDQNNCGADLIMALNGLIDRQNGFPNERNHENRWIDKKQGQNRAINVQNNGKVEENRGDDFGIGSNRGIEAESLEETRMDLADQIEIVCMSSPDSRCSSAAETPFVTPPTSPGSSVASISPPMTPFRETPAVLRRKFRDSPPSPPLNPMPVLPSLPEIRTPLGSPPLTPPSASPLHST